jgi:hypothetical protein
MAIDTLKTDNPATKMDTGNLLRPDNEMQNGLFKYNPAMKSFRKLV